MGGSGQWLSFLLYLLILAGPAIGWIIKKVKEQSAIKAERERQRTREYEKLRTTQVVERTNPATEQSQAVERQREMRDLAMRRQAQLQELRQRQLEAARQRQSGEQQRAQPAEGLSTLIGPGQSPPAKAPTRAQQASSLSGPTPYALRTPAGAQQPTQRQGAPAQRPTPTGPAQRRRDVQRPGQQSPGVRAQPTQRPQIAPIDSRRIGDMEKRRPEVAPPPSVTPRRSGPDVRSLLFGGEGRKSKDELRRLFAISEAFAKPVSLRRGHGHDDSL